LLHQLRLAEGLLQKQFYFLKYYNLIQEIVVI